MTGLANIAAIGGFAWPGHVSCGGNCTYREQWRHVSLSEILYKIFSSTLLPTPFFLFLFNTFNIF